MLRMRKINLYRLGWGMYRVMIVDDEPIIVRGLSKSVPWDNYQCEVVATASDGLEAMDLIEKIKPDIVFMDICMPGMTGLAVIAALKLRFENIEFTILTGYRDFEYAQQAIRLGVTRFIVKPSQMEDIKEAIETMVANLDQKGLERNPEVKEKEVNGASNFIVKNAIKYMEENYYMKLKLCDVAEKSFISQWHLSKILNRDTGQNFSEILNGIRIAKAKELLKDPSFRIGDVAEEVGFLDIAHFSRVFKKLSGVSANEYRNSILLI